ncbi:peptidylprolyl isomerase [Altererythrobacter sp. B11]|uniref:FKBP-type peptidyl-prolyl cis-trans isomerase n=1 Tax=Altererythrobacter sp. B11 TaxID=2060312 RepID=UPI000DC70898|nr:FKBP-type peptidyl-prolyl cis-trans isomerase [Altererythrobacter sp. B11]BBC74194.1 peptidylprolyl isomerase [Altererythrobacter sp. B11]
MAEVTRVPLHPIAKGSLSKLWLGVAAAVLIAGGVAWSAMPAGVHVETVTAGTGAHPTVDDVVFLHYTGKLPDGTVFDQSQNMPLPIQGLLPEGQPMQLAGTVPGFQEAVLQMQRGGKYVVEIPADKAYGSNPPPGAPIPPDSDLTFEIELVDFMPLQEAQQRFEMLQRMMQQQMPQQGGSPAGPPPQGAQ